MKTGRQYTVLKVSEIKAYDKNNKKHGSNVDEIVKSIQANTYITPIIVDEDNVILAGHGRKLALDKMGVEECEVLKVYGLSENQKRDFRIRDNKLTELSERDLDNLRIELDFLESQELNSLFDGLFNDLETTDEKRKKQIEDEIPEVKSVTVKHGDMYKIGDHVLLCGDSMNEGDVKRLLDGVGNRIVHCISDPPYGIAYNPDKHGMIMNDDKILDYVGLAQKYTNGFFAMWTGYQVSDIWKQLIEKYFKRITNMIIRHKGGGGLGDCLRSLAQDFEILFVVNRGNEIQSDRGSSFWNWNKEEKTGRLRKAKKEDMYSLLDSMIEGFSTWKVSKDNSVEYMHPTQKPVEINDRVLINFTSKGDYVLDLFGGSGSNMISCQKMGRKCRMMELDPKYCQVIIDRMKIYEPSITIKKI